MCSVVRETLEAVFEVQEAVFRARCVRRGRGVPELGVGFVALRLAPRELDLGGVVHDDVIARADVERAQAVDEKL